MPAIDLDALEELIRGRIAANNRTTGRDVSQALYDGRLEAYEDVLRAIGRPLGDDETAAAELEAVPLVPRTITDQEAWDVLTTAAEGGSNYWAAMTVDRAEDLTVTRAVIRDREDDEAETYTAGAETIRRGVALLWETQGIRSDLLAQMAEGFRENPDDGGSFGIVDADVADCILQAGLFGEVVYG